MTLVTSTISPRRRELMASLLRRHYRTEQRWAGPAPPPNLDVRTTPAPPEAHIDNCLEALVIVNFPYGPLATPGRQMGGGLASNEEYPPGTPARRVETGG